MDDIRLKVLMGFLLLSGVIAVGKPLYDMIVHNPNSPEFLIGLPIGAWLVTLTVFSWFNTSLRTTVVASSMVLAVTGMLCMVLLTV
jgi:hypothetical protein